LTSFPVRSSGRVVENLEQAVGISNARLPAAINRYLAKGDGVHGPAISLTMNTNIFISMAGICALIGAIRPANAQTQPTPTPAPAVTKHASSAYTGAYTGADIIANEALREGPEHYRGNHNLTWDLFFTDKSYWDKAELPDGNWELESRTDTVLKYSTMPEKDNQTQSLMGIVPLRVRIRISSDTGKVISSEILWDETYHLTENDHLSTKNRLATDRSIARRKNIKDSQKPKLAAELNARFSNHSDRSIGKTTVTYKVTDYETPSALTIRFWKEEANVTLATIQPTATRGTYLNEYNTTTHNSPAWAKANVIKLHGKLNGPDGIDGLNGFDGDVFIKNLPMVNQNGSALCWGGTHAMSLEYWGMLVPAELYQGTQCVEALNNFAKEIGLHEETKKLSIKAVIQEIEAGRPVIINRYTDPEKTPESCHCDTITGYNAELKEFLITDSWGEGHRNTRMSYDDVLDLSTDKVIRVLSP